jgi:hypothetical protein
LPFVEICRETLYQNEKEDDPRYGLVPALTAKNRQTLQ